MADYAPPARVADDFPAIAARLKELAQERENAKREAQSKAALS